MIPLQSHTEIPVSSLPGMESVKPAASTSRPENNTGPPIPTSTRIPLLRQRSTLKHSDHEDVPQSELSTKQSPRQRFAQLQPQDRNRRASNTSQTWAELQNTLEEVELNAGSSATVFGAQHARALEELRSAQVELARAWARGEEGEGDVDDGGGPGDGVSLHKEGTLKGMREASAVLASDRGKIIAGNATDATGREGGTGSGKDNKKSQLEEETENDILLARKRRVANDRYFERVNRGVLDVVEKLEAVASKMGGVELSSQEIWGDGDSIDGGSIR